MSLKDILNSSLRSPQSSRDIPYKSSTSISPLTPTRQQKVLQSNLKAHVNNMGKYMDSFLHDFEQLILLASQVTKISQEISKSRHYWYNNKYLSNDDISSRTVVNLFPDLGVRLECKYILEAIRAIEKIDF